MPTAREIITSVRVGQMRKGFTLQHDIDEHSENDDLIQAACAYAQEAASEISGTSQDSPPASWPWDPELWKPVGTLSNLAKAAALLEAALDVELVKYGLRG